MNPSRSNLARTASLSLWMLITASACADVLGVQPVSRAGTCASHADCPRLQVCAEQTCRDVCASDAVCPRPLTCRPFASQSVCRPAAPLVDAQAEQVPADWDAKDARGDASHAGEQATADAAPPSDGPLGFDAPFGSDAPFDFDARFRDGEGGAMADVACRGCEAPFTACVQSSCRELLWVAPEVSYPQPPVAASPNARRYAPVPQNELYAHRIYVPRAGWLLRAGILASTAQPQAPFGIAIYDDRTGYPLHPVVALGPQLPETDGDNGRRELVAPAPVHVAVGTYWIVFVSEQMPFVLQTPDTWIATARAHVTSTGAPFADPFPSTQPASTPDYAVVIYAVIASDPP